MVQGVLGGSVVLEVLVVLPVLWELLVRGVLGVLLVHPFPYWTWQSCKYLLYPERYGLHHIGIADTAAGIFLNKVCD